MKTPLLALLFFAPLHPVALGCEKCEPAPASITGKTVVAQPTAKTAPRPASAAPPPAATTAKPPATKSARPPAYLFM